MTKLRAAILALLALAMAGCANTPSSPELQRLAGNAPVNSIGWVMFSLTKSGLYMEASGYDPELDLRGVTNDIDASVETKGAKLRSDTPNIPIPVPSNYIVTHDNPLGSLVLLELPAGDYQFYRFSASATMNRGPYSVTNTLKSSPAFSYRFRVIAGKVAYIGNLDFAFYVGGTRFNVRDERDRDWKLFDAQFPAYKGKEKIIAEFH